MDFSKEAVLLLGQIDGKLTSLIDSHKQDRAALAALSERVDVLEKNRATFVGARGFAVFLISTMIGVIGAFIGHVTVALTGVSK